MNVPLREVLCTHCGAPCQWDGDAPNITCSYCKRSFLVGQPPPVNPAMQSGGGGGSGVMIFAIVGAVLLLLVCGGGAFAFFGLRSPSSVPPIAVTVTTPAMPAMPAMPSTASSGSDVAKEVLSFGDEGNGAGQLTDARAITVDMDEDIYVADYDTARVQKFDPSGKFQWIIEVPKNSMSGDKNIWSLVVDTKSTLWVARTGDLLEFASADGKTKGTVKGDYDTTWFQGLAIGPTGNMASFHSAAGDTDLLLLEPSGKVKKRIKNVSGKSLAMDGANNVYVTLEYADANIEVYDATGNLKTRFGSKKDVHTKGAGAIAVDGKGHIFIECDEGLNALDAGGAYLATIPKAPPVRSLAVSAKGNLFVLSNAAKVIKYELGPTLK